MKNKVKTSLKRLDIDTLAIKDICDISTKTIGGIEDYIINNTNAHLLRILLMRDDRFKESDDGTISLNIGRPIGTQHTTHFPRVLFYNKQLRCWMLSTQHIMSLTSRNRIQAKKHPVGE